MPKILGRYPAVIVGVVSAVLQILVGFGVGLTDQQTASINAAVAAVLGVITAFFLAQDQLLPVLVGFGQAVVTLGLAFGYDWPQDKITMVMAGIAALVALLGVHPQVTAVVAPDGSRVPRQTLASR